MKKFSVMLAVVLLLLVPPGIQNNDLTDIILKEPVEVEKIDSAKFANITIPFIENQGQIDEQVKFYAKTFAGTVYVTNNDLTYHSILKKNDLTISTVVKENFVDGTIIPSGTESSHTVVNYFKGTEENWRTNIPTYSEISLGQVWNDVDVSLKAYGNNLEKIFTIHPYGDVSIIRANFDGITNLSISDSDELIVDTTNGKFFLSKPVAFQNINGITKNISASYEIIDSTTYGFSVEQYDHTYDLVIDPIIAATFLGGSGDDSGEAIDTDDSGNVYVASRTASSDFPVTSFGTFISNFGIQGTGDGQFDGPEGITVDSTGNIYVVDFGNERIQKFDSSGIFLSKFDSTGTGDGQFDSPIDVTIANSTNHIYVTDSGNNRVQKLDLSGNFDSKFGSPGTAEGEFNFPFGIAIASPSANIYVVDASNFRIQKFNPSGGFTLMFGFNVNGGAAFETCTSGCQAGSSGAANGQFNGVKYIAIDSSENIYVVDSANDRIQKFHSDGAFVTKWGTTGTGNGQFDEPYGITIDSDDNVYVSDLNNDRIQKFTSGGSFVATFGSTGSGDGQLSFPTGLSIDSSGTIYVSDNNNARVQKFSSGTYDDTFNVGIDVAISKFTSDLSTLLASTFIGGAEDDIVLDIDIDSNGNVFIVGFTINDASTDYPSTSGAFDEVLTTTDPETTAFISKFTSDLSTLTASTFIGGADTSDAFAIAIDGSGNIFITGAGSSTYPVTVGAFDETFNGGTFDVVVSKISNDLETLLASTFLGSDGFDAGDSIDFDSSGNVYVTGETDVGSSTPLFPTTGGAFTTDAGGSTDGFVTKFDSNLSNSGGIVSTLLGGSGADNPTDIHVDATSGDVYVVGFLDSSSTDFPVTSAIFLSEFGTSGSNEGEFSDAEGVAVDDASGNIIVSDLDNDRIQVFDSSGNFQFMFGYDVIDGSSSNVFQICTSGCQAGAFGPLAGQFDFPAGVAVNGTGNIIVGDSGNHRVQIFDSSGNFVSMFGFGVRTGAAVFENCTSSCKIGTSGSGDGQFAGIELIEVDSSNNIYVADASNNRIQKFSPSGSLFLLKFGSTGTADGGLFSTAHDVVINSSGKIIVADRANHRVQIFDSSGNFISMFGSGVSTGSPGFETCTSSCLQGQSGSGNGEFTFANSVALDSSDNIYVSDTTSRIQKFDSTGSTFISKFGASGTGPGQFTGPHDITIDNSDHLILGDNSQSRISTFDLDGAFNITHNGGIDGFISRFSSDLGAYLSGTFIGGSADDFIDALELDSSGKVYITGDTADGTTDFPVTSGSIDETHNGGFDAFVTKLSSDLSELLYSTFLGGASDDTGVSLVLDDSNFLYVVGETLSTSFPVTSGAFEESHNSGNDVFLVHINPSIDTTAPVISSITSNAQSSGVLKIDDTILFTLTPTTTENGATVSGSYNSQVLTWSTANSGVTFTATYTVVEGDTDQSTALQISGVTITDVSSNTSSPASGTDVVKTIDANKPTMDSAAVGSSPTEIILTFSEPLEQSTVIASDFTVTGGFTVDAVSVSIAALSAEASPGFVTLTLTTAFSGSETIDLAGAVSDIAGNEQTDGSLGFAVLVEGVTEEVIIAEQGGTASFSYTEAEQEEEETLSLDVTLPADTAGTISVTTAVEDDLEQGVDLATAVDIVAPCTNTCTISFTVVDSLLIAAGLDPTTANIYHDSDEDGSIEVGEDIATTRDSTTISGSTIFSGEADFVSKFAVGGVKALAVGGGGGSAAAPSFARPPPSFSFGAILDSEGVPIVVKKIEFDMLDFENEVETETIAIGEHVEFRFAVFENSGGENVKHFEFLINLTDKLRAYHNSDTYIIYDEESSIFWSDANQQESDFTLTTKDPNGFFESVDFDIEPFGDYLAIVTLNITFAKAMPESDIYLRIWDAERNSRDVIIKNAIEIIDMDPEPVAADIVMDPEPGVDDIKKVLYIPEWIKNSAGWWSDGQINDETFIKGIEFLIQEQIIDIPIQVNVSLTLEEKEASKFDWTEETEEKVIRIPDWVKNNSGWWAQGLLSDEEFINAIKFLVETETIMI